MSTTRSGRATARDVARLVGCSVATVSLVVNGKAEGRVTEETRERVWSAVRQLDYRVNSSASTLATGLPHTVAFVSPDPTNPFFSLVLESIVESLDAGLSLTLLVPSKGGDYDPQTVQRAMAGDLAGLILASPGQALLETLSPTCPTVLLDAGDYHGDLVSISLDMAAAAQQLAEHLVGLGHRRLAYVGVDRDKASLHHRRDALQDELVARGAAFVVPDVDVARMTSHDALQAALASWDRWRAADVTAVICGDDLLAYGVLEAARARGTVVPDRLSVAGFNDLPYSSMVTPALTSVDLSARQLGTSAVSALRELIASGSGRSTVLPARLVVRTSTATAP